MINVPMTKATCACEHECKLEPGELNEDEFRNYVGQCANCGATHEYVVFTVAGLAARDAALAPPVKGSSR